MKNIYNFPNLPIIDIVETKKRFLIWIKPFVTMVEFNELEIQFNEFIFSGNAHKIQSLLLLKTFDEDNSWLANWWKKYIYLASRGPINPECNANFIYKNKNLDDYDNLKQMSIIIYELVKIYLDFKLHGIPNINTNPKISYSMDQMYNIFCSFRIPGENFDSFYVSKKLNTHILFLKNNVIYKIEVIDLMKKEIFPIGKIFSNICEIVNNDDSLNINFNFISAECNRNEAAEFLKNQLLNNSKNIYGFDKIKDAIIIVCYDNHNYKKNSDFLSNLSSAKNFNRCHGKPIEIIFSNDKRIGIACDHTTIDAGTLLTIFNKVSDNIQNIFSFEVFKTDYEKIDFNLNKNELKKLEIIFKDYQKYLNLVNIKETKFPKINTIWIKNKKIISFESFIHIAFQMAQYKTNGLIKNTYSAVDLRNFFCGRTECLRPISIQSVNFVKNFVNKKITNKNELKILLQDCYDEQYLRTKDCKRGHGLNRHQLGIDLIYLENSNLFKEKPKLLTNKFWFIANENYLSTSSICNKDFPAVCFNPVHENGLGIYYAYDEIEFRVVISYWVKNKEYYENFIKNLKNSIIDLMNIYQ